MTVKKHVFVTNWVGKGRNPEILIPIDAARLGDLENRGFGQTIRKNNKKKLIFLFGVLCWGHLWLLKIQKLRLCRARNCGFAEPEIVALQSDRIVALQRRKLYLCNAIISGFAEPTIAAWQSHRL